MITNGQPINANDFVSTSAGAGDSGKGVKLNASGKLDVSFMPINPIVRVYTTSGSPHTWTKPTGLKYIIVEVQGGGGGGDSSGSYGGGGGAGGYARKVIGASILGTTETATVGSGGGAETNGGTSTFTVTSGTNVVGNGGTASTSSTGGAGGTGCACCRRS